jgi:putative colanic acid biosynthesis UDP-glucose lipid carrier transferase
MLIASHITVRSIVTNLYDKGELRSAVVIGANETSLQFIKHIADLPFLLISYQGFFDERSSSRIAGIEGSHTDEQAGLQLTAAATRPGSFGSRLGGLTDVVPYVQKHNIEMVFISLPMASQPRIQKLMDELPDTTTSIYFLPDIYIFDLMQARFEYVGDLPVVAMNESPFTRPRRRGQKYQRFCAGAADYLADIPDHAVHCVSGKVNFSRSGYLQATALWFKRRRDYRL